MVAHRDSITVAYVIVLYIATAVKLVNEALFAATILRWLDGISH